MVVGCTIMMAACLDLNQPAPDKDGAGKGSAARPLSESLDADASSTLSKLKIDRIEKIKSIHDKTLKLFKVLAVCDDENFDIEQTEIPENWVHYAKALMVLNKINSKKLIMKKDMVRLRRILGNCNQIDARVRQRDESSLDAYSQMSGMTEEEAEKFRRDQEENPLEDLRSRFISGQRPVKPATRQQELAVRPEVRLATRAPAKPQEFAISSPRISNRAAHAFFKFL